MGFAAVILFGALFADVANLLGGGSIYAISQGFIYFYFGGVRDWAGSAGHGELLVFLWTACCFNTDPDRWAWRGDSYGFGHIVVREKDFSYAAYDNAGCHCSAKDRRNCPTDEVYIKRNISGRAIGAVYCCRFRKRFGVKGIWMSIFHSISAFAMRDLTFSERRKKYVSVPPAVCGEMLL